MATLRQLWSSIVFQVTALTLAAMLLVLSAVVLLFQTPAAHIAFPQTVSANAASVAELIWLVENSPAEMQPFLLSAYEASGRITSISETFDPGVSPRPRLSAQLAGAPTDAAARLQDRDIRFKTMSAIKMQARLRQDERQGFNVASALQVAVTLDDGRILNIWLAPVSSLWNRPVALLVIGGMVICFSIALGLALASVILRPIRQLQEDAERVDLGEVGVGVEERGAVELRQLSAALNRMRSRLARLIREREQMVAAIAHDVRTGLTRLRLRMDDADMISAAELESDVSQMERLITDMLTYARADSPDGTRELVKLETFARTMTSGAPYPVGLTMDEDLDFEIAADPVALRRMFENLLENARRYGAGHIAIRVVRSAAGLDICVEDDGPGLPKADLETVFQPFARLEASRNRATGGSGLGLGIARSIARAHGATLHLANRRTGGLAAIVHFPEALRT